MTAKRLSNMKQFKVAMSHGIMAPTLARMVLGISRCVVVPHKKLEITERLVAVIIENNTTTLRARGVR